MKEFRTWDNFLEVYSLDEDFPGVKELMAAGDPPAKANIVIFAAEHGGKKIKKTFLIQENFSSENLKSKLENLINYVNRGWFVRANLFSIPIPSCRDDVKPILPSVETIEVESLAEMANRTWVENADGTISFSGWDDGNLRVGPGKGGTLEGVGIISKKRRVYRGIAYYELTIDPYYYNVKIPGTETTDSIRFICRKLDQILDKQKL